MSTIRLVALSSLLVAALAACDRPEPKAPVAVKPAPTTEQLANATTVAYRVDGMHCGGCAAGIQEKLAGLDGVLACSVTYEGGTATVTMVDATVTPKVESTIAELGYEFAPATNAEESPAADVTETAAPAAS
ncbi:MAG: heavy-metal-associated domain-containing protein [Phycisphaerales bacterium]|jgi:copper chaperone CopZ